MKSRLLIAFFLFSLIMGLSSRSQIKTIAASNITWTQISTAHSPSARYLHGMAYDSSQGIMVLFGGDNTGYARLNDTWEYDGTDWHQLFPAQSPSGRVNIDQALDYDSRRGKLILFGGLSSIGYLNDTWEFNGSNWTEVTTSQSPLARDAHVMAYDPNRNVTVLFGGFSPSNHYLNDTWEYNGTSWRQVYPPQSPPGRFHSSMTYDSRRRVIVLFGGTTINNTKLNDTWEYDGTTWHQVSTPQSPTVRENHSITYDSKTGVVVLFGGYGNAGTLLNDTWEYNGTTWLQISTSQSPSARGETSLAYDSQRNKIVFFGGGYWSGGFLHVFNDTWELQLPGSIVSEARLDIGMPYPVPPYHRGCPSDYVGCGGTFHGFYLGVCADLVMDAYNAGVPFNIQNALYQDYLNHPERYPNRGTARNAEDMLQYFKYNQTYLLDNQPYQPGDIAFFDWDNDNNGIAEHVLVISEVYANGRPKRMMDAPNVIDGINPTGRAFEHDWTSYYQQHVLGHARLSTLELAKTIASVEAIQVLRVSANSASVGLSLYDTRGKSVSDTYDENYAASNNDVFIPYIPYGSYTNWDTEKVITITHPLSSTNQYFVRIAGQTNTTYTLLIESLQNASVTASQTFTQTIGAGEIHNVRIFLTAPGGVISFTAQPPISSPNVSVPSLLSLDGLVGTTVQIKFNVTEIGGQQAISNASIIATDLSTQYGIKILSSQLTITPANFSVVAGSNQQVSVQINLANLDAGEYLGSLILTSQSGSPIMIPLTLRVQYHTLYLPSVIRY